MILVTGAVFARTETFEELRRLSLEHVHRSRNEPGCVSHDVHVDCENPLKLVFVERWENMETLRRHFRVPAAIAFVRAARRLSAASEAMTIYEAEAVEP